MTLRFMRKAITLPSNDKPSLFSFGLTQQPARVNAKALTSHRTL